MSDSHSNAISMEGVTKSFGQFKALRGIDLAVKKGQKVVVCGPSGSGKSTMIRCINRLEEHDGGHIVVNGIELSDATENIDAVRSEVGMVFQQFNLFPHLTALENVEQPQILVQKKQRADARDKAAELFRMIGLEEKMEH